MTSDVFIQRILLEDLSFVGLRNYQTILVAVVGSRMNCDRISNLQPPLDSTIISLRFSLQNLVQKSFLSLSRKH